MDAKQMMEVVAVIQERGGVIRFYEDGSIDIEAPAGKIDMLAAYWLSFVLGG